MEVNIHKRVRPVACKPHASPNRTASHSMPPLDPGDIDDLFAQFAKSTLETVSGGESPSVTRSDADGRCSFCSSCERVVMDGVWSCMNCHTVTERVLDYGAEWRVFQNDDGRSSDVSRCSAMTSDLIAPLGCVLRACASYGGGCGSGVGQRARASRAGLGAVMMSKHQSWNALSYRERSLCKVFELMSARTSVYNIASSIVQEAKQMYKQVSLGRIFRGDSRISVIAACVYMALRSSHAPRSICEVASMFELTSRSSMIRGCNLFHSALPRQLDSSSSGDFVARFCCKLGMTPDNVRLCKKIAARVDELYLVSDCTPPSVVGAIIHLVNQHLLLGLKRNAIAEACMVSSGTIARCCRRLSVSHEEFFSNSPLAV